MSTTITENSLQRLPQVLELIPISRSAWWAGCKSGRFPKLVKIGPRTSAWKGSDLLAILEKINKRRSQLMIVYSGVLLSQCTRPLLPHVAGRSGRSGSCLFPAASRALMLVKAKRH